MIGNGWKLLTLLMLVSLMGFAVWELRDFGEPSGKAVDNNLDGVQDVGDDGRPVWDNSSGQIDVYDEETGSVVKRNRTMMDDNFLENAADPNGTVNANNVVTAVVFDYRGFDTLGEATILFAAVSGVLTTIRTAFPKKERNGGDAR